MTNKIVRGVVDFADAGNLDSTLLPCHRPELPNLESAAFSGLPDDVVCVEQSDGSVSAQIRGLEFAKSARGKLTCGLTRRTRSTMETVAAMAREIARVRSPGAEDRQHPLYSMNPEGWLESQVRAHPEAIDAALASVPDLRASADLQRRRSRRDRSSRNRSHRPVGGHRDQSDRGLASSFPGAGLLAAGAQASRRGRFRTPRLFPGHVIRPDPPRILLVAPALEFHSTTEILLGAMLPAIEIMRIGLAADWRSALRVMFRLRGSERPQ